MSRLPRPPLAAIAAALLVSIPQASAQSGGATTDQPIGTRYIMPEDVHRYVRAEGLATVEEFLTRVNPIILRNYVLMERSASLQQPSTVDKPRLILFRPDGRFFMGIATNPESGNYNDVEIIALDDEMRGHARGIDFDRRRAGAPRLHDGRLEDGSTCLACHGPELRPIWGSYNRWTGAFGAATQLSGPQAAALTRMLDPANSNENPRLRKLEFFQTTWREGVALTLPQHAGRESNESMNDAISGPRIERLVRWARTVDKSELLLVAHAFAQPEGPDLPTELRRRLDERIDREWRERGLAARFPAARPGDRPLLLLGFDASRDLDLPNFFTGDVPDPNQRDLSAKWDSIVISIGELLAFRVFNDMAEANPSLKAILATTPYDGSDTLCAQSNPGRFATMEDFWTKNAAHLWRLNLTEKLERLRRGETPPTVFLRMRCLFPTTFRQRSRDEFTRWVEGVLARFP